MQRTKTTRVKQIACSFLLLGVMGWQQAAAQTPTPPATAITPVPDVGSQRTQTVRVTGTGSSPEEAVDAAIRLAVLSANGATVDLNSTEMRATLQVAVGVREADLRAHAFADVVTQRSKGAVTGFNLIDLSKPVLGVGDYSATIEARVAKFQAPADNNRVKIVVAPLHYSTATFDVGGQSFAAKQIATDIQQQVVDLLTQTNRFAVLDRDYSAEVLQELDLVSSGQASTEQYAKLGQALPADVIWTGSIESFQYQRHARALESSDRQLVSYSGSAMLSHRLVNVATRQILLSDTLTDKPEPVEPTTLPVRIDTAAKLHSMEADLASQIVMGITQQMFPITVVSRNADQVVLSQGGKMLVEHATYQVVVMGDVVKDPQTGQILGHAEQPCCTVTVDRVTPSLAYGHLNGVSAGLDGLPTGALQLRKTVAVAAAGATPDASKVAGPAGAVAPGSHKRSVTPSAEATATPVSPAPAGDKNW